MYTIQITDTYTSATLPALEVPLTETTLEGTTDITTLDMNLYVDFFASKRLWGHVWSTMTEAEFAILKGFYDRQFTLFAYPTITITELGIADVVVRMTVTPQRIIDHCGTVQDVEVSFRETVQITEGL